MDTGFKFSKKLLYSSFLAVVIVGSAIYMSTREAPSQSTPETGGAELATNNTGKTADTTSSSTQDSTNAAESQDTDSSQTPERALTDTDLLTRNLLRPYIEQSNSGTYSKESKEQIIANATKEMFKISYEPLKIYNISTTNDISKDGAIEYKKRLYTAISPMFELQEYELTIYARAVRDNSKEEFDSLLHIASVYKSVGDGALLVQAPLDASATHLDIVNSLYKFSTILTALAKGYDDPAASLAGTGNFTQSEDELGQAFDKLKTYFILKDVDKVVM